MCSNLCENNFEKVYNKFDHLYDFVFHTLNSSINVNSELNIIINESSHFIIKKLNNHLIQLTHNHARLDANYQILNKLLKENNEDMHKNINEMIPNNIYPSYHKEMNFQMFIIALILFFITGYGLNMLEYN